MIFPVLFRLKGKRLLGLELLQKAVQQLIQQPGQKACALARFGNTLQRDPPQKRAQFTVGAQPSGIGGRVARKRRAGRVCREKPLLQIQPAQHRALCRLQFVHLVGVPHHHVVLLQRVRLCAGLTGPAAVQKIDELGARMHVPVLAQFGEQFDRCDRQFNFNGPQIHHLLRAVCKTVQSFQSPKRPSSILTDFFPLRKQEM